MKKINKMIIEFTITIAQVLFFGFFPSIFIWYLTGVILIAITFVIIIDVKGIILPTGIDIMDQRNFTRKRTQNEQKINE